MSGRRGAAHTPPSDEQLRAILAPEGPLLIVAGPGSGKTATLAERIGYLVRVCRVPPQRVLAFSFTRAAAATLRDRLALRLGPDGAAVDVTTFHAFGRRVVERWAADLGYDGPRLRVLSNEAARALLVETIGGDLPRRAPARTHPRGAERGGPPGAARRGAGVGDATTLALAVAYEAILRSRRALDFPAMLALPLRLFAHRPEVLRRYRDAYRHILVDEYQDVNLAQYRLARLLAGEHRCLAVVGDPAQTIYGFAGASADFLLAFPIEYADTTVAPLTRNYRSTGRIVEATNVIAMPLPYGRPLWTANAPGPRRFSSPPPRPPPRRASSRPRSGRSSTAARSPDPPTSRCSSATTIRPRPSRRALGERGVPHIFRRRDAATGRGDRVRLGTIHGAKGGEWAAVFVVGLEEGLLPDHRAARGGDDAALVAERHLAYVAVSRARERLYLTHCARRPARADTTSPDRPVAPSRFLVALPVVVAAGSPSTPDAAPTGGTVAA